jgi:hypothetical protein
MRGPAPQPGHALTCVGGKSVRGSRYFEVIELLRAAARPLVLTLVPWDWNMSFSWTAIRDAQVGFGRIAALHCHSSTSCQICEQIR